MKEDKKITKKLDNFLDTENQEENTECQECQGSQCIIKGDKSLIERINKKVITEDGRELLNS